MDNNNNNNNVNISNTTNDNNEEIEILTDNIAELNNSNNNTENNNTTIISNSIDTNNNDITNNNNNVDNINTNIDSITNNVNENINTTNNISTNINENTNSINKSHNKSKKVLIISLIIPILLVGGFLFYKTFMNKNDNNSIQSIENNNDNSNTNQYISEDSNINQNHDMFYGIEKEERYKNNELRDIATYIYDESGNITSTKENMECEGIDECGYTDFYDIGLFRYKYKFENNKFKKLARLEIYSGQGYFFNYDENLNITYKVDEAGYMLRTLDDEYFINLGMDPWQEYDIEDRVIYEYDNDKVSKRTTIDYDKTETTVTTFTYDNNGLLISEKVTLKHGSSVEKKYEYDNNRNVTKCTISYIFYEDDGIIVEADSLSGSGNYSGNVYFDYTNEYNENNKLDKRSLTITTNKGKTINYKTEYKYDNNKNLIEEKVVDDDNNTYTRKLYYKEIKTDETNYKYKKKLNQIQTNSYYINDGLLVDWTWLSLMYRNL